MKNYFYILVLLLMALIVSSCNQKNPDFELALMELNHKLEEYEDRISELNIQNAELQKINNEFTATIKGLKAVLEVEEQSYTTRNLIDLKAHAFFTNLRKGTPELNEDLFATQVQILPDGIAYPFSEEIIEYQYPIHFDAWRLRFYDFIDDSLDEYVIGYEIYEEDVYKSVIVFHFLREDNEWKISQMVNDI